MSRSYRRPYAAITGTASAKDDKRMAQRGIRRKQDLTLKTCADFEELLLPHRLECAWNNTYSWGRDGSQMYFGPERRAADEWRERYHRKLLRK
ncbi:hypothetical protein [Terracidiphilus sp.]|jgi:hypothetical protein|uniref:hypothetical protein n=1 Tax=Terracidiphilus sp. TaxID=1964191 RepID=UPI003C1CF895